MAIYGYARASTLEQNVTIQEDALRRAGCEVIRSEKVSGSSRAGRSELALLLQFLRHGDTLMVTRVDRLARSIKDLQDIVHELRGAGVTLRALPVRDAPHTPISRKKSQELPDAPQKVKFGVAVGFGITGLALILIIALFIPIPTLFQYQVFRIILSCRWRSVYDSWNTEPPDLKLYYRRRSTGGIRSSLFLQSSATSGSGYFSRSDAYAIIDTISVYYCNSRPYTHFNTRANADTSTSLLYTITGACNQRLDSPNSNTESI
jgi:hypothetical protein